MLHSLVTVLLSTRNAKGSVANSTFGTRINISTRVHNDIVRSEKKGERRLNYTGKDDRATSEQVLDPRTRLILFKMLGNGTLDFIDGEWIIVTVAVIVVYKRR